MLTTDEIFESFPGPTTEMKKEAEKLFTHYILYESYRNNQRDCECTYCRTKWRYPQQEVIRGGLIYRNEISEIDKKIYYGKYNNTVICPHCGITAVMKTLKKFGKSFYKTETKKIIFVIPGRYNAADKVYLRAYYVSRRPDSMEYEFSETTRYYMTSGQSCAWKYIYDYTGYGGIANGYTWRLSKRIIQPFTMQNHCAENYWYYIGMGSIRNTFLKYSQYAEFSRNEFKGSRTNVYDYWYGSYVYKYLCTCAKYPQIEMLMKAGFYDIAEDAVYQGRLYKRYLNWNAKNFTDFFRLNKQEIQILQKQNDTVRMNIITNYKDAKKRDPKITLYDYIIIYYLIESRNMDAFNQMLAKYNISLKRFKNYIQSRKEKNQREVITEYFDYIEMAEKLNYDLNNDVVLFPKNLTEKHDIAVSLYNATKQLEQEKSMRKLTEKLYKKYHYENDDYMIRIPESMQEIIEEGKALEHCVGSYAERHAKGTTVILFLRRKSDPDKPFFTIEMHGDNYRQIQGYQNEAELDAETKIFFDEFLNHIKRDKIKPAANQVTDQVLMPAV